VESGKHTLLTDQVAKLREDMFTMKNDVAKVDEHSRQLEALHNSMSVDSARVKHLSLMYAGSTGGGGDARAPGAAARPTRVPHTSWNADRWQSPISWHSPWGAPGCRGKGSEYDISSGLGSSSLQTVADADCR